jgi:hypothetical protein
VLYGFGYCHQVKDLDKFPTQKWPKQWPAEGEPVISFASVSDPTYNKILKIIRNARNEQLLVPRIDMPGADIVGSGIKEGRSRQIIPMKLPDKMPEIEAVVDANGFVRLGWESSARTIGLVAEIHRSTQKDFTPSAATKIGSTERDQYCDKESPSGKVYYAVVFVSDPAATCGTCKSGSILDYQHTKPNVQEEAKGKRCTLTTFETVRGEPLRLPAVNVPATLPPLRVSEIEAVPSHGKINLSWQPVGIPGVATYDIYGKRADDKIPRKLNTEALNATSFSDTHFHQGGEVGYAVIANAPHCAKAALSESTAWITTKPLPVRMEPVFTLKTDGKKLKLKGGAKLEGKNLLIPAGHAALGSSADLIMDGPFSFVLDLQLFEPGKMPVILGCGQ